MASLTQATKLKKGKTKSRSEKFPLKRFVSMLKGNPRGLKKRIASQIHRLKLEKTLKLEYASYFKLKCNSSVQNLDLVSCGDNVCIEHCLLCAGNVFVLVWCSRSFVFVFFALTLYSGATK